MSSADADAEMAPEPAEPEVPETPAEEETIDSDEYDLLDAKLDDLNAVLDVMEQKTDRIREEFAKLLESNREIREELKREFKDSPKKD